MLKKQFLLIAVMAGLFLVSCSEDDTTAPDINAGSLSGGPYIFCTEDGTADNTNITLSETILGDMSTFVITDTNGEILALPATIDAVNNIDFDENPSDKCLIWHLTYRNIQGLSVGNNAGDLTGFYSLSNSVLVDRDGPKGGILSFEDENQVDFTFTIDSESDFVSGIIFDENVDVVGSNSTFVVTDASGVILGLPMTMEDLEDVDFNEAGTGTCLIWHLSFEDGLTGATIGESALNLSGCFELSNSITINRI